MEHPKVDWKENFKERYSKLTDWDVFVDYSLRYLRRSIRINTLKTNVDMIKDSLKDRWNLMQVPWYREGFWIDHKGKGKEYRRDIGNIPEHSLGMFFIQEAASMIPPLVLGPRPGEKILDLCASPGAKTTQIAAMMQNKGVLVANDYRIDRIKAMGLNIQRMGITNCIQTMMEGRFFRDMEFDRILVDAPCSGTGTIRKSLKTIRIWNPNMVRRIAGTQRQLMDTAFNILKPGGTMVYSTCTLEPEENEGNVSWFLDKHGDTELQDIRLNGLKRSEPVLEFEGKTYKKEVKKCLRIWPQDNDTEGFFVAKIKMR